MPYRTITLKIYKPSRKKREIMDIALYNYGRALQLLFDRCEEKVTALSDDSRIKRNELLSLIGKPVLKELNLYNAEPFKDALKYDFAAAIFAYMAQRRQNPRSGYPAAEIDRERLDSCLSDILTRLDGGALSAARADELLTKLLYKSGRLHSVYFGRYAQNRDYCLLYDDYTKRFYAKLYLLNAANRTIDEKNSRKSYLKYIMPGLPQAELNETKKRYILVPLAFGKYQLDTLKKALVNPNLLHTARLLKKQDEYYLVVSVDAESADIKPAKTTMGVARNAQGGVCCSVLMGEKVLLNGEIQADQSAAAGQKLFILAKKIVAIAEKYQSQVVVEALGGRNDAVVFKKNDCTPLRTTEYQRLAEILGYKLPGAGLPAPTAVSANGLYSTCPRCGANTRKNRLLQKLFACVECGYAETGETIGSFNLAQRLLKYKADKIPIYCEKSDGNRLYFNKTLGFSCTIPDNEPDLQKLYYELKLYIKQDKAFESNRKKYGMIKKLRSAENIRNAVKIIE